MNTRVYLYLYMYIFYICRIDETSSKSTAEHVLVAVPRNMPQIEYTYMHMYIHI